MLSSLMAFDLSFRFTLFVFILQKTGFLLIVIDVVRIKLNVQLSIKDSLLNESILSY